MEFWTEVRRRVLTGQLSKRATCRQFGLSWHTLAKILAHEEPPGYRHKAPRHKPKLEPFLPIIHEILRQDVQAPKKQRHTAWRILERLRAEHGFTGGYTIVKEAVRAWKQTHREVFLPLNEVLAERCRADLEHRTRGCPGTKGELLVDDQAAFLLLPKQPFEARRIEQVSADSQSLVRFDTNSYSVPVKYAHRKITVVATVDEVRLVYEDRLVARHPRCWQREQYLFEPVHYLALLERKPGGFDHARPLENWPLPECFGLLRRRLEAEQGGPGTRAFIRVLRLLESFTLAQLADAVEYALDIDVIDRERRAADRRLKAARFPSHKTLDTFDFTARPSVNKPLVLELARGEYLQRRENLLLVGPSGTGKTHLATALGIAACGLGKKVRFYRVTELITTLLEAKEERQLLRIRGQLAKLDLLILDELGYVPASKAGAELLFDVIATAYERNSVLVTTNLPFENWPEVLGNERLTGAALDRLTHRCHILETKGESYRLKEARRRRGGH